MIAAIIVTYFPDFSFFEEQVKLLLAKVDKVVVVDNGSGPDFKYWAEKSVTSENFYLLDQGENLGIAEAQNIGIDFARSLSAEYVVFFDQDSLPGAVMIENLLSAIQRLQSENVPVAAVAPCYSDSKFSDLSGFVRIGTFRFQQFYARSSEFLVEADFLIASGTLVPMVVLSDVGNMDSSLFIDHVDTEWCLRAKSMGYRLFGVCNAVMNHSLGENRRKFWFLRWRVVPFHKPFRYYYIFRNSVNLWGRDYMPLRWKFVDFIRLIQMFLYFGVFSSQRLENVMMMWRGFRDGLHGVSGKMSL